MMIGLARTSITKRRKRGKREKKHQASECIIIHADVYASALWLELDRAFSNHTCNGSGPASSAMVGCENCAWAGRADRVSIRAVVIVIVFVIAIAIAIAVAVAVEILDGSLKSGL